MTAGTDRQDLNSILLQENALIRVKYPKLYAHACLRSR